jgi:hypothetical protein
MKNHADKRALLDAYRVAGFKAQARVGGYDHMPPAFAITFVRRQKKRRATNAERQAAAFTTSAGIALAISIAAITRFISTSSFAAWTAKSVAA